MSYALDFDSGKLWAAEQLEAIATRYLNRSARIIAQQVRETIQTESQNLKFTAPMRPPLVVSGRDGVTIPNVQSWPSTSNNVQYHVYMTEDEIAGTSGTSNSGTEIQERVYPSNFRAWDGLQ